MSKHVEKWIIGIDEVGRGPLAGPITVAAVAVMVNSKSQNQNLDGIRDSKKLSPKQRERWNTVIRQNFPFAIASVSHSIIDKKGIRHSCSTAITEVLKKFFLKNPLIHNLPAGRQGSKFIILLDGGLCAPSKYKNQQTITKGDEKVLIIAAASIVAKVHRDRYMVRLHKKYPQYGFDKHKGYGTALHREAIQIYGLSECHRASFCKKLFGNLELGNRISK